ncbi:MAG: hypothetical protein CM15mP64_5010 [Candidatus Neomarinimicrobiota bacterium]|nr:MAG: hypothetical protein CM15mP64_5010 [Candidatus Neomarinimicrobiota bacterium]
MNIKSYTRVLDILDIENETMPVDMTMDGKDDHPNVFVDGDPATNLQYLDDVDNVDPSLPSDRKGSIILCRPRSVYK